MPDSDLLYRFANDLSLKFLQRDYLLPGQSLDERVTIIARNAEAVSGEQGLGERVLSHVRNGYWSFSTPVWTNAGTDRGLPISCYGSYTGDSIAGILRTHAEIGMMSKLGGGTASYWGDVRPAGSTIRGNGVADGPMHYLHMFEELVKTVRQGSTRNASMAAYLDVTHPAINEFLTIRELGAKFQEVNPAVCISDDWMRAMIAGDQDKRNLQARILTMRSNTGYPFVFFTDNVARNRPDVYRDRNLPVRHSNLCLAGESPLLTVDGYRPIRELWLEQGSHEFGGEVPMAQFLRTRHGTPESSVVVRTSKDAELWKLTVQLGTATMSLRTTPQHEFMTGDARLRLEQLRPGDQLQLAGTGVLSGGTVPVLSIEPDGRGETFCVNEPKHHEIVVNGLVTGNCTEIALPTNEDESFVCCLSSLNLEHYDEWKDRPEVVHDLVTFLDAIITEFITKARPIWGMERAVRFAERHRALGMGVLGWHTLLQKRSLPFESMEAKLLNAEVFSTLRDLAYEQSATLATKHGECAITGGYGRRNATLLAIAPTVSSSAILGQPSAGIEPYQDNYTFYNKAKASYSHRNPQLKATLARHGWDDEDTWKSILHERGSVQHLDFLSNHDKEVFRTELEISPMELIVQAAQRQKWLDQGQSLNLTVHPSLTDKDRNALLVKAWELGVCTLYYQKSVNVAQETSLRGGMRDLMACTSCQ